MSVWQYLVAQKFCVFNDEDNTVFHLVGKSVGASLVGKVPGGQQDSFLAF